MSRTIIPGKVLTLHADYLQQSLLNPKELVAKARSSLKGIKFDTMVSRGLSGALVVPMLARALRKNWLIIRKDNDGSHSSKKVEGTLGERWMFIDDLVSSGHTRTICFEAVDDLCRSSNFASAFVGTWTYTNDAYYDEESEACTYEQLRQRSPVPMPVPCEVPQPMPMPVFPAPKDWMITAGDCITNDSIRGFMSAVDTLPSCEEVYKELKGAGYTPKPKTAWRKDLRELLQQQVSRARSLAENQYTVRDGKLVRARP